MSVIRKNELKNMKHDELKKKLEELQLELAKERGAAFSGIPKNPGKIREIRKTIARIKTFLHIRGGE